RRRRSSRRPPAIEELDRHLAPIAPGVTELDARDDPAFGAEKQLGKGGPLDEGHRVRGQVIVEKPRVLAAETLEPKEVEVRHGDAPAVTAPDRERGRLHRIGDAELAARPSNQRGLSGTELTAHHDDV